MPQFQFGLFLEHIMVETIQSCKTNYKDPVTADTRLGLEALTHEG